LFDPVLILLIEAEQMTGRMAMGKKIAAILIMGVLFVSTGAKLALCNQANTYRNESSGFAISYPPSWDLQKPSGATVFNIRNPAAVSTISVVLAEFDGDKDGWMQTVRNDPRKMIPDIKALFANAVITEKGDAYMGGLPAYFVTIAYTRKSEADTIEMMTLRIVTVNDGKIYSINYTTRQDFYINEFHQVKAILASFTFIKPT
jgi:hypothetical protein